MPINNGSKKIAKIYYGPNEVAKGYYGGNLVFENEVNQIFDLGTGYWWDVPSIVQQRLPWGKFTVNNFFITTGTASRSGSVTGALNGNISMNKTYTSGLLTINMVAIANGSSSINGRVHAFLVTRPQDIVHLGEGQEFDVSNYEGYENFTEDNFLIKSTTNGQIGSINNTGGYVVSAGIARSYDPSTGIFICNFHGKISGSTGKETSKNVDVYLRRK
jgi:hypothetical protein